MDRIQDHVYALLSSIPCANGLSSVLDLCGLSNGANALLGGANIGGEIKLNGRTIEIDRLLGEGGFSFVYLARDKASGREFALKKIRCSHGSESFTLAMKEIEAMRRFRSPNIIQVLDSAVIQETDHSSGFGNLPDGQGGGSDGRTVYLFLPYYPLGNVQDAINRHAVNGTKYFEREMLSLFLGTCRAVEAMHRYRLPDVPLGGRQAPTNEGGPSASSSRRGDQPSKKQMMTSSNHRGEEGDNAPLIEGTAANGQSDPFGIESDAESDGSDQEGGMARYPPRPSKGKDKEVTQSAFGDEGMEGGQGGEMVPYAHRDIKPGNIIVSQGSSAEGNVIHIPILMDFGSTMKAHVVISSRREAVAEQDLAAEHSTLPYRAPELFDVKTDSTLTEAVDIWSLGCTLYAMAYHYSPFETPSMMEQGASTALAVLNNKWDFPRNDQTYSEGFKEIVRRCLVSEPEKRANIEEIIELTQKALQRNV